MLSYILNGVFNLDKDAIHDLMTSLGVFLGKHELARKLVKIIYDYHGADISKTVDGIKYRTPFMLSAGFDYNGKLPSILPCIGLGGEEIGSITARSCAGNSKPRIIYLPKSKSILVNKGLRNNGVDAIIRRLKNSPYTKINAADFVIGISIARTNDEKSVPIEAGIEDYAYTFRRLNEEAVGDYYTLNISCPNVFGAEAFSDQVLLPKLLAAIKAIPCTKPIYVKMPINIPWEQFASLLKIVDEFGLNGVVIGNLNKDYNNIDHRHEAPVDYKGGLSGKPCSALSNNLISKTRQLYGNRFTIIGVGGVMDQQSALDKFNAGADLVQLLTGLIFEGPKIIKKLNKAYAEYRATT